MRLATIAVLFNSADEIKVSENNRQYERVKSAVTSFLPNRLMSAVLSMALLTKSNKTRVIKPLFVKFDRMSSSDNCCVTSKPNTAPENTVAGR